MAAALTLLFAFGGTLASLASRRSMRQSKEEGPLLSRDPRIPTSHTPGTPCPTNPAPPAGWAYWTGAVSPALTAWATHVLHTYPIGTFLVDVVEGQRVGARVEWHTSQGATGATGCFVGVNLLRAIA